MAEIRLQEQALRTAAGTFTAKGASLRHRVESLQETQTSLTATWTGSAADAYGGYQDSWNGSALGVADAFTSIGTALGTIADNFRSTEDAATEVWPA